MSIKEFAQKNGEVFFGLSIVLFIVCVVLCFNVFSHKGPRNFDRNEMRGQNQMMDGRENRQLNRGNFDQGQTEQVNDTSVTTNETPDTSTPQAN